MASTDRAYFHELYRTNIDPWHFESSWYERRKYDATVAALPEERYRSAFEPGCSVGVLSAALAARCDHLLATDIVPEVLDRARRRCADQPSATFAVRAIPEEWPAGPFDLMVLSEIAYYFEEETLHDIVARVVATTTPSATIVGVHWRGPTDYPLSGDAAHAVIDARPELDRQVHHLEDDFVLDVWRRR